jgi:hypothetical protein
MDYIKEVQSKYPQTMKLFSEINKEQVELFSRKQYDYGKGNIEMGGNKGLSLLALSIRMNDKVQRMLNILYTNKGKVAVDDEALVDTFRDISIYGIIAQIVSNDKWGK